MHHSVSRIIWIAALFYAAQPGTAAVVEANPANYRALLRDLNPGDTLNLAPGNYSRLPIRDVNGTPDAWITITGPKSGPPAVIFGVLHNNTVEITNCSYLAIENLRIDSRGIPGAFGISAREHDRNVTHHIRIEGNVLVGLDGGQQTDGISTKTPTWGWIIRNNQILGAGTGMYLGDSTGLDPFVAGVIENNLIQDSIGYNLQIKYQIEYPSLEGFPSGPTTTIIRHNVFIKNDVLSPDGDRPNVLLGSFPASGRGSLNMYEVYGNYFVHNHREALLQASGRLSIHDNIFVDGSYTYPAVVLRKQEDALKIAYFYNNTIYTWEHGIQIGSRAEIDDAVTGNLIFALNPLAGFIANKSNNILETVENAVKYVHAPSYDLGSMDFYPLPGKCQGTAIDLSPYHGDADYALDFNGRPKTQERGAVVFRGAYAGEGTNPGWQLQADVKPPFTLSPVQMPALVWMSPPSLPVGAPTLVTFTGANFSNDATLAVSGTGITVSDVKVTDDTQITATIGIARDGATETHDVTVNTPAGSSNPLTLKTARPRPAKKR